MDVVGYVFLVLLVYLVTILWYKTSRYIRLLDKLPGPKRVTFFGNFLHFWKKREDLTQTFMNVMEQFKYCPVVCWWLFHLPFVFIVRSSAAEVILSSNIHIEKSRLYKMLHPWIGQGLLTSTGDKWRSHRKLLTPSFHFRLLENFMPIFNEQSEILVSTLMERESKGRFDIYPYITRCTLDIICDTAMGKRINAQRDQNSEYVRALNSMSYVFMERVVKVWLQIPWIFKLSSVGRLQAQSLKVLHKFTNDVIQERKRAFQEVTHHEDSTKKESINSNVDCIYGRKHRMAFLDTLLEASKRGNLLTDEEIREEVDTFMFEGHDTTAAGISWTVYALGWCPTVQNKVHKELDDVFGNSDRPVNIDDLSKLKYLEATIKETHRFVPPVPLYGRRLAADVNISGYQIPAGTEVVLCPGLIHRDPELFADPESYNPSRFFAEDWQKRRPYAYVPFSAGPRNCIGQKFATMEEKVVLTYILRTFKVRAYKNFYELKGAADLVYRPLNGMYVTLEKRTFQK